MLAAMEPAEWKRLVGDQITDRRRELGIKSMRKAATRAGFNEAVWRQLESGRRQLAPGMVVAPSPLAETQEAACRVLRWRGDSIERLLSGEPPVELPDESQQDPTGSVADQIEAAANVIAEGVQALRTAAALLRED